MWRRQASYGTVLLSAEETKHNRQRNYGHSENQMFSVAVVKLGIHMLLSQ